MDPPDVEDVEADDVEEVLDDDELSLVDDDALSFDADEDDEAPSDALALVRLSVR